ncbi:MAG TPA: sensor histidine kinase [Vicinamibacterales bacterium]|nr:sensor histidine kinase [Vicinamibacterales bacterium]
MIGSLRARVWLGAILWTLGLLALGGMLLVQVMYLHPNTPQTVHRIFLHVRPMTALVVILMIVGLIQISRGVSPIAQLRHRLASIHQGEARRMDGDFPSEVQPLVDDLNILLAERDRVVERAQAKAGDLAHTLKTPLAILLQEAEIADRASQPEIATAIRQQVERMQRQMDYHLAHARAAASGAAPGTRCEVSEAAEGLARTLRRLYADRGLAIALSVPDDQAVRVERADLEEMLGNLLDNACKWAASRVSLSTEVSGSSLLIMVDDDGTGVEDALLESVLQRGVRADETAPGSGFGLAIVRDLAEVYGGAIALSRSPLGGLRATLTLPAA